ncbi:hypothetical protein PanWU01x14_168310 [Parasponia andersonii]|uniref:Uncharacterized protein n=1 Tax=Parasponia andersonii TaxID=3476 RepID=A0A2P5CB22_PARAD|nr:hypothetical protein PanWU01x14_168310 [Parasponia andersonii]
MRDGAKAAMDPRWILACCVDRVDSAVEAKLTSKSSDYLKLITGFSHASLSFDLLSLRLYCIASLGRASKYSRGYSPAEGPWAPEWKAMHKYASSNMK